MSPEDATTADSESTDVHKRMGRNTLMREKARLESEERREQDRSSADLATHAMSLVSTSSGQTVEAMKDTIAKLVMEKRWLYVLIAISILGNVALVVDKLSIEKGADGSLSASTEQGK